jgi:UDP-N-acetylmuramoyl-tripeptide--D-alanyl-D-alanine ligase
MRVAVRLELLRLSRRLRRGLPGRIALRVGVPVASWRRGRLDGVCFIGITGSNGKTTTKELVAAILETQGRTIKTQGNRNFLSPVGATILKTRRRDRFFVAEVGTMQPGDIPQTAALLRPQIAVVTGIGSDHRSSFKTFDATAAEKRSLVEALQPDGVAVLNADDPRARAMAAAAPGRVVLFGEAADADLRAEDVEATWPQPLRFTLVSGGERTPVATGLYGAHWVPAVLAALAVAEVVGMERAVALVALAGVAPPSGRMEPRVVDGVTFLLDDFKGSADSVQAALAFLDAAAAQRKVVVLGELSDLPRGTAQAYPDVARASLAVADEVVFVGPKAKYAAKAGGPDVPLRALGTVREAAVYLRETLRPGDLVLVKGNGFLDHQRRIVLAFRGDDVGCWRERCGRNGFCETCALLTIPSS